MGVLGVLPLGLNVLLEQVEGGSGLQLAGSADVVVQAAAEATGTSRERNEQERTPKGCSCVCSRAPALGDACMPRTIR